MDGLESLTIVVEELLAVLASYHITGLRSVHGIKQSHFLLVSSFALEVIGILVFSLGFLNQCLAPVLSNIKLCPRKVENDLCVLVSLLFDLLLVGGGLSNDLSGFGFSLLLGQSPHVLSCNDCHGLLLLSLDLVDSHLCFTFNYRRVVVDLGNIPFVVDSKQRLLVVSSQLKEELVLGVVNLQQLVSLVLHLLLEHHIVIGGLAKISSQVGRKQHLHDVDLLYYNAVRSELSLKLFTEAGDNLRLGISNSVDPSASHKVSNSLVDLLGKQLLESIGSEVVEELGSVLLISLFGAADVEVDSDVQ